MGHDYLLSRSSDSDAYGLWRVDLAGDELLQALPLDAKASFDRTHTVVPIGRYLLEWGPQVLGDYAGCYPYRLIEFDPASPDPLSLAAPSVQKGVWTKAKFWQYRADFGNPHGAHEGYDSGDELLLLPVGSFLLNLIPTVGRGTFQLWNFDPAPLSPGCADPLPAPYTPQGSFDTIQFGHELTALGNYVLDRVPGTGQYWLWSFDPQDNIPLAQPAVQRGTWTRFGAGHQFVTIGEHVLTWQPADGERRYQLWRFDPKSADPLVGPVREGRLPDAFGAHTALTGVQSMVPVDDARKDVPGTMDFMRSRIKHVVYLMLENRAFDHVCGWLYDKGEKGLRYVGHDAPFDGASLEMFNLDPTTGQPDDRVYLNKFKDGRPDPSCSLDFLPNDPYHDKSDVMRQCFYGDRDGYARRERPDMGGFVWNNGVAAVMTTYTPEQLPILNGLAREFAVSDEWFSAMPGATDANRAMAFTGSTLGQLNNFQNGLQYVNWPATPHRASMWKTLWANGFTDWKIYNSVEWMHFVHTYHLFVQGQIPSVDANTANYIAGIEQFKSDARAGTLPAFSFLEPAWIAPQGTTSYHPGADLVPGECALNEIYDAIKSGPAWNETLFVVTFDEHGGLFDHVPPPYAEKPWPNDSVDGFDFDLMGVRVPTILVSPWIDDKTVFRSPTPVPYDGTSFMATLLHWAGVPRSRWALGDRVHHAPTFEGVFRRDAPRAEAPSFTPPVDREFPGPAGNVRVNDLHRLMTPRLIWSLAGHALTPKEADLLADEVLGKSTDLKTLYRLVGDVARRFDRR